MAQTAKPAKPSQSKGNVLLLAGVAALVAAIGLFVWGLAPAKELVDAVGPAFSGGPPPEDLGERIDASIAKLTGRAWADGLGFVLFLGGVVLCKQAFAKPKPKPMEQLVQEEVERRLAAAQPPAHGGPALVVPVRATVHAVPLPPASGRRTHCADCQSILVAGGRVCPRGHAQA